jgi:hypothetical protein
LIIDEVLAVGDAELKKSHWQDADISYLKDRTVLFCESEYGGGKEFVYKGDCFENGKDGFVTPA